MKFNISLYLLSKAFWGAVPQPELSFTKLPRTVTHQNASYLVGLCQKMQVETVIEIGSGVSTSLMSEAVKKIWTGDRSPWDGETLGAEIEAFTGESTEFLAKLTEPADLFFIDGRLYRQDVAHITRLSKPHTVYVLDDFEGLEKGVSNAFFLSESRLLMQPVDGKYGRSTLAVLIPQSLIRLVNQ